MTDVMSTTRTGPTRRLWLLAALPLAAVLLAATAFQERQRAASERRSLAESVVETQRLAATLRRLEAASTPSAAAAASPDEISNRVQAAQTAAGIDEVALREVQNPEPTRVGRTDFVQRATRIELREVTLPQVAAFAIALEDDAAGLVARRLRLTTPRSQSATGGVRRSTPTPPDGQAVDADERWNAELTLTQTIRSPTVRER